MRAVNEFQVELSWVSIVLGSVYQHRNIDRVVVINLPVIGDIRGNQSVC
jgi:hypothetical protein